MSLFGEFEEWPATDAYLKDPSDGPEFFMSFQQEGFGPTEAGELASLALDKGYYNVIYELEQLAGVDREGIDEPSVSEEQFEPGKKTPLTTAILRTLYEQRDL